MIDPHSMNAEGFLATIGIWATEGVLGLVAVGLIRLWVLHYSFREEVARDYVKDSDLVKKIDKVDLDIGEMRKTTTRILELVAELRGRHNGSEG